MIEQAIAWLAYSSNAPVLVLWLAFAAVGVFLHIEAAQHDRTRAEWQDDVDDVCKGLERVMELLQRDPRAARHEIERMLEART